ncbi:hypothetical protein RvY_04151 [Ramazzottius varieornatus]|uniref:Protein alan shepard n=1 Tax=Ramazzottius varieornatus TaxID=947166 RepID=A0A1D1UQK1_RAMVA|nr:hypothetical protein RvY_04151 [Ramazzottius varieornatus]
MDNTSTGSSPLTDGEVSKNDIGGRQSNNEDDDSKKTNRGVGQAQPGSARKMNNTQQPVNQGATTWRSPVPGQMQGNGINGGQTNTGMSPQGGQQQQQQRFPRPRAPGPGGMQAGGAGLGGGMLGGQGGAGGAAWPGASGQYGYRPPRYAQSGMNSQNLTAALGQYAQHQGLSMGGGQGGYGGRGMTMGGMGGMGGGMGGNEPLSKTNLYIRGLPANTTDRDLYNMCCVYGTINSTKAIIDKMNNTCKGYGFVDFEIQASAERALKELASRGMQVQMAKIRQAQDPQQFLQDPDPTNLYLANLSPYMGESDLEAMLQPYGHVVSTRVLRDIQQKSRGVGFARMETRDVCEKVIEVLNGKILAGSSEPLVVKFADSGNRRRNMQNRERGWGRMDNVGMGGYDQMGGGQNGMANSMMASIRYQMPQTATLGAYGQSWQPQYTLLPQQMTQMMPDNSAYSVTQLAAQMGQLGLSSAYNQSPYSQYGYNPQMYQAGLAQMQGASGGAGQGEEAQQSSALDGMNTSNGSHSNNQQQQNMTAVYSGYQQQK